MADGAADVLVDPLGGICGPAFADCEEGERPPRLRGREMMLDRLSHDLRERNPSPPGLEAKTRLDVIGKHHRCSLHEASLLHHRPPSDRATLSIEP